MIYSAFSTYSCITYYEFFKLSKLLGGGGGGQNDMFAPPRIDASGIKSLVLTVMDVWN